MPVSWGRDSQNSMAIPYLTPLSPEQQTDFGLSTLWPLALADRVRFAEVDLQNHANNAAYLTWFETARVRYFRDWGMRRGTSGDPHFVLRRSEVDYLGPLHLDDDYVTTVGCTAYRRTSFTLGGELWTRRGICARFTGILVLLAADGSGKMEIPADVRRRFDEIDGAVPA